MCRAISTATGLSYETIGKLLDLTAEEFECDKLCLCCYQNLLENIMKYKRIDCDFKYTVGEIARLYPTNTLIIRIKAHLTSALNGVVLDIWDCTDEFVDCYWVVS